MSSQTKDCHTCGEAFTPSKYARNRAKYCSRKCCGQARDPEQRRAYGRAYHERHREVRDANARAWRENNRDRAYLHDQRNHLKRYGLSPETYVELLAHQGGACAICRTTSTAPWSRFCIDHDHDSGAVRGLLCQRCNVCIGQAGDDVDVLRKAIAYLEST
jgi:hypothetical protein